MPKFHVPDKHQPPMQGGLAGSEKIRLILMGLGLVLVIGAFVIAQGQVSKYRATDEDQLPEESMEFEEQVALPPIDAAALEDLVADGEQADRVVLEDDALALVRGWNAQLTPRHFEELGARLLDDAGLEAIAADPATARAEAFSMRGTIATVKQRGDEWLTRIALEDESVAYALVDDLPAGYRAPGAFLRFDGLFVKLYTHELEGAGWVTGPLFACPYAKPSFHEVDRIDDIPIALAEVQDDGVTGTTGEPYAIWSVLAYARDLPEGTIDWESAPLLDNTLLQKIKHDGAPYRGQPVRIPISKVQAVSVTREEENPARIAEMTRGWIGNTPWKDVIQFRAPFARRDLSYGENNLVEARGFFVKNLAYEPKSGGIRAAPLLVLTHIDRFTPGEDGSVQLVLFGVVGVSLLLMILFPVLLMRDKRRSKKLHEDIVRRRRARRQREAVEAAPSA